MTFTPVTLSAAVLSFIGIGFFVGRISSSDPDPSAAADAAEELNTRPARSTAPLASGGRDTRSATGSANRANRRSGGEPRNVRIESIMRGENALERSRALLAMIDQLGPGEFEDAVAHFRSLGITDDRMAEYSLLLSAWAAVDPVGALAYSQANTRGDFARNTILTAWAGSDPEAAIRWANSNHQGDEANPHLIGVIRGIAANDPARATELLTSMPRSGERGQALDGVLPHLLARGAAETRDWIYSLTDESLRNGALERSATRIAALDPAMAVDLLVANPGQAADRRMDDVYREWAGQNQSEALASMNTLPPGDLRSNALRGIAARAASDDPRAAIALLDRYPNDVNDRVLHTVTWSSFRQDPSASADLIARYSDPGSQERMYRRTLGVWLERDPNAANDWISRNPVPESVLQRLFDQ